MAQFIVKKENESETNNSAGIITKMLGKFGIQSAVKENPEDLKDLKFFKDRFGIGQ